MCSMVLFNTNVETRERSKVMQIVEYRGQKINDESLTQTLWRALYLRNQTRFKLQELRRNENNKGNV